MAVLGHLVARGPARSCPAMAGELVKSVRAERLLASAIVVKC